MPFCVKINYSWIHLLSSAFGDTRMACGLSRFFFYFYFSNLVQSEPNASASHPSVRQYSFESNCSIEWLKWFVNNDDEQAKNEHNGMEHVSNDNKSCQFRLRSFRNFAWRTHSIGGLEHMFCLPFRLFGKFSCHSSWINPHNRRATLKAKWHNSAWKRFVSSCACTMNAMQKLKRGVF